MSAMFRSFAARNYRIWFAGAIVSNVGTWMQRIAQDWLVLTQLTDDDATAVGITMALQFGPAVLLLPLTGTVADRMDRRRLLLITQLSMAALGLGLGVVTLSGHVTLPMLYAFAGALGVAAAFDAPARQAFVGELVPDRLLSNAVALNSAAFNGARLVGPAIAGVLVAGIGEGWVFILNAASFLAVCVSLVVLRPSEFVPFTRLSGRGGGSRAALRYVRARPDLLLVFGMIAILGTLGFNFPIFTATMSRLEFGAGAEVFGVLGSVVAIGSVSGALRAARRDRPRLRTLALASAAFGASLGLGAVAPNVWVYGVTLVFVGFSALSMMTSANAYVQTTTAPSMRGRVMALYLAIFMGGTPIGGPLLGWVADAFGPRWALGIGAAAGFAAAGLALAWYARHYQVRLRIDRARRWPWRLQATRPADREQATQEIAIIEVQNQR